MRISKSTVTRTALCLSFYFGVFSCKNFLKKDDSDDDKGQDAAQVNQTFVTVADVNASANTRSLAAGDIRSVVNKASELYANMPKDSNESDDACTNALFEPIKFHSNGKSGYVGGTLNFDACTKGAFSKVSALEVNKISLNFRFLVRIDCSDGDLSSFEGKSYIELTKIAESSFPCHDYTTTQQSTTQTTLAYSYTVSGQKYSQTEESTVYSLSAKQDGTPCHLKYDGANITMEGECVHSSRKIYKIANENNKTSDKEGREDVNRFILNAVKQGVSGKPTYYTSGSAGLTVNDWSGSLTYSGADKAPSWTMKKGTQTISDTLIPTSTKKSGSLTAVPNDISQEGVVEILSQFGSGTTMLGLGL